MAARCFLLFLGLLLARAAEAEVTIVLVAPSSGIVPYVTTETLRGIDLAIAGLNESGGLLGQKLTDRLVDDACDAGQAPSAAKLAISIAPVLVIGGDCSSAGIAVGRSFAAAGILQMVANSPSQTITEAGIATLFRMTPRAEREGAFTGTRIATFGRDRRIAIADDGNANWHETAMAVAASLKQRGIEPVLMTQFGRNRPRYDALVGQLAAGRIELLYVEGTPADMGNLVRQIGDAALAPQIVTGRNATTPAFLEQAGAAADGAMLPQMLGHMVATWPEPVLAAEQAAGRAVGPLAATSFAGMTVWSQAVAMAGSFDAAKVASIIKSRRFRTAIGDLAFDERGDLTPDSVQWRWYRWRSGRVEPAE